MERQAFLDKKNRKRIERIVQEARKRSRRRLWRKYHPDDQQKKRLISEEIVLPQDLDIMDDDKAFELNFALQEAMENSTIQLDFRNVQRITLQAGLSLKAFSDAYILRYHMKPLFRSPRLEKIKAVFCYLEIREYHLNCHTHYKDLDCWHITSFDKSKDEDIPKLLSEEIIPKCLAERNEQENARIATAISETLFNCREHAYNEDSPFQKWYLGYGRYPHSDMYHFCVCDKGMGFRGSIQLRFKEKFLLDDSNIIKEAANGRTGVREGAEQGRGLGLKVAIQNLRNVGGMMLILSGKGLYMAGLSETGGSLETAYPQRRTSLEGSLIDFKTVSALCCYETANKAFKLIFTPYNGTNLGIALPSA